MENQDRIFIEPKEKIRLLIDQNIGLSKILDLLETRYRVSKFSKNGEEIILIEEKDGTTTNH